MLKYILNIYEYYVLRIYILLNPMEDIYILAISAGQLSYAHVTILYFFLWAVVPISVHFLKSLQ